MTVSASAGITSAALQQLSDMSSAKLTQQIAVNVLKSVQNGEAAMVAELLESGSQMSDVTDVGSHVDFRA